MYNMSQPFNQQPTQRKVSFLLGLGIFLIPIIFVWFTLRSGYSTLARVISFIWLIFIILITFALPSSSDTRYESVYENPTSGSSSNVEETVTTTEEVKETAPSVIQVSAKQLFQNYEANEVAADRNFKGQWLEITGSVQSIASGIGDGANVNFYVGDDFGLNSVTASGNSSFDDYAASLSKGQKITLRCIGAGEVIGQPLLSECSPI